jgi:hypothetical protein
VGFLLFLFVPSRPSAYGMVLRALIVGLSPLVNPLWKCPHKHLLMF